MGRAELLVRFWQTAACSGSSAACHSQTPCCLHPLHISPLLTPPTPPPTPHPRTTDKLLVQHDRAVARQERASAAASKARLFLKAAGGAGDKPAATGWRQRRAAAQLERSEADVVKWQEQAVALEGQVAVARQTALERPLGTAFFALFKCVSDDMWGCRDVPFARAAVGTELRRVRWVGPLNPSGPSHLISLTLHSPHLTVRLLTGTRQPRPSQAACRPAWQRA